jgi:hypothetical protein
MRVWLGGPRILGIRTGISLGKEDLGWLSGNSRGQPSSSIEGSFVYVIKGDHHLTKIGVSTNPNARLAQLRTASPFPIEFAYIAVTPGNGFDIEAAAHAALSKHRCNGEWFDVAPEMAVAAISGAAFNLSQPLQPVTQEMVGQILQIAAAGGGSAPPQHNNFLRNVGFLLLAFVVLWILFTTLMVNAHAEEAQPSIEVIAKLFAVVHHISGPIEFDDEKREAKINEGNRIVTVRQLTGFGEPCRYKIVGPRGGNMASMTINHIETWDARIKEASLFYGGMQRGTAFYHVVIPTWPSATCSVNYGGYYCDSTLETRVTEAEAQRLFDYLGTIQSFQVCAVQPIPKTFPSLIQDH